MRSRRGRNEGSIDQITRRRRDGSTYKIWRARLSLGCGVGPNQRAVYGQSKAAVIAKLLELQGKAAAGAVVPIDKQTVGQYLTRWLEDSIRPSYRISTYTLYEMIVRVHIKDRIGALRLQQLRPPHVERMLSEMERKGASGTMRQKARGVLHKALKQALRWHLVTTNACEAVDKPRTSHKPMKVLDLEQARQFLDAAKSDRLHALYVLALATGMRQGELLGLQWEDVHLAERSLSVRHTLTRSYGKARQNGKPFHLTEPKTEAGRRRVDLPDVAVHELKEHRARMLAEGLCTSPFVFCGIDGNPLVKGNVVNRSFRPILERAGLPIIRFHDLRHTAATLMLKCNVHPKIVQSMLGHANVAITLSTYSHVLPTMQREAADKLDAILKARPSN
ncbi:MAG: site-specific integrase [Candidatus Eremiobacter antarcticus]|nr:MAG: site-specific integrase [Candidatus Eremiobacter sp. RRmetagenome_bin22]